MRWSMALVLPLLAACTALERAAAPEPAPAAAAPAAIANPSAADQLIAYVAGLKGLSDADLVTEAGRQRRQGGDLARVKAAAALALAAQAEESEIVALVEPVMRRETADPQARAMASFLHALAADRRRLKESAASAGARLREERRHLDAQKQRVDALQEKAAQLQQKLDALTEIEKSLSDRAVQNR